MKRSIIMILALNCTILAFAQSESIPSSIKMLGERSIEDYLSLVEKEQQFYEHILATPPALSDFKSLIGYADQFINKEPVMTEQLMTSIETAMSSNIQHGADFSHTVSNLSMSFPLKKIVCSILDQLKASNGSFELDNILSHYAKSIDQLGLTATDRENLRLYIIGMNASYYSVINSNWIKQKQMELSGGKTEVINGKRGLLGTLWDIIKCILGTVGSTIAGGIAGAGSGTVTLPIIGTVSGAAVGAVAGAAVGVASFC